MLFIQTFLLIYYDEQMTIKKYGTNISYNYSTDDLYNR